MTVLMSAHAERCLAESQTDLSDHSGKGSASNLPDPLNPRHVGCRADAAVERIHCTRFQDEDTR